MASNARNPGSFLARTLRPAGATGQVTSSGLRGIPNTRTGVLVTRYADTLRRLREYLSGKVEFESPTIVFQRQLHHALDKVEADNTVTPETYLGRGPREVIRGRLDQWSDRLQISVNFRTAPEDIEAYRSSRDDGGNAMERIWERWIGQKGRRFEDWYDEERRGIFPAWLELYQQHLQLVERQMMGGPLAANEAEELINPRMTVMVVFGLIHRFRDAGYSFGEAHARLRDFFSSQAALNAPANDISSLLMAALARKAASGQKKVPNRGTPNDINAISSYLPYCEAMFVDDQFAGLLREEPLLTKMRPFKTHIFSNRTRAEFLEYLNQIEASVSSDHLAHVIEVYGAEWLTPFRSILEDERARRSSSTPEAVPYPSGGAGTAQEL